MKVHFNTHISITLLSLLLIPIQLTATPLTTQQRATQQQEACADCHPEHVRGFLSTGMGKALYPPNQAKIIEKYPPSGIAEVVHPVTKVIYQAWIDETGKWWQSEKSADGTYHKHVEVKYVIGSGNHTRSYLSEIHGEIYELPLTWYTRRQMWDMSPGYHQQNHFRFSRPIKANCLFCHNDLTPVREDRMNAYKEPLTHGISCVRCHGDGEAHIQSRLRGEIPAPNKPDPHILNPKHLTPQRQLQICQQCHLAGEARSLLPHQKWDAYDPRTPLQDYMLIYGYDDQASAITEPASIKRQIHKGYSDFGIASHGERLNLSACAQGEKVLTCSTCHNPHQAQSDESYNQACLGCHQTQACSRDTHANQHTIERKQSNNCSDCHMNKGNTSDIPHVHFTDHWIRKYPKHTPKRASKAWPLKNLLPDLSPQNKPYEAGLLAMAYSQVLRFQHRKEYTQLTIESLVKAGQQHSQWPRLWKVLAEVMLWTGYLKDAQIAYFEYAKLRPNDWNTRVDQAIVLKRLQILDQAEVILRDVVSNDPSHLRAWGELATLLQLMQRWDEAIEIYQQLDQVAPDMSSTAFNRSYIALLQMNTAQAKHWIKQGIQRDGVGRDAPFYQSSLAALEGNTKQAIAHLDESIKRDANFVQARSIRAGLLAREKQWPEAIRDFEFLLSHNPYHAQIYVALSNVYQAKGDLQTGLEVLKKARKLMPNHPVIEPAFTALWESIPSPQR